MNTESRAARLFRRVRRPRSSAAQTMKTADPEKTQKISAAGMSRGIRTRNNENTAAPAAIGITLAEMEAIIPSYNRPSPFNP